MTTALIASRQSNRSSNANSARKLVRRHWLAVPFLFLLTLAVIAGFGFAGQTTVSASTAGSAQAGSAALDRRSASAEYGKLPLSFEENRGQTDPAVKFLARGPGYTVFLTGNEAVLSLRKSAPAGANEPGARSLTLSLDELSAHAPGGAAPAETAVLRMKLAGMNPNPQVSGDGALDGATHYLRGKDASQWKTNIRSYQRVQYQDVYRGVNLVYYGNQGQLEYDFVVAPGADAGAIALKLTGAHSVQVDRESGDLLLAAGQSQVRFHRPVAYQREGSARRLVEARYVLANKNRVKFALGPYDRSKELVIDPTLSYGTYIGSRGNDYGYSIAISSAGEAYVTGYTTSAAFPVTSGAYQTTCGGGCTAGTYDAFITKLNAAGTALVYSTYLGGSGKDLANGIAVDSMGDAYVVGTTFSTDFPVTPGAIQNFCGDCAHGTAFVTQLNPSGSGLVYSTYLGGGNTNAGDGIAIDASGNAYVTGYTASNDFPTTPGAYQTSCASCTTFSDAFVSKINPSGTNLIYSTYLGGNVADVAYAIALDSSNNAYITGYTYSTIFPTTPGAFQTSLNAQTGGFVSKLNASGTALSYSTYLGGSGTGTTQCAACASAIAVDAAGNAFVTGLTWELNFPTTPGAYQTVYAGGFHDVFITKLNTTGTALVYSTYVGGNNDDGGTAIAVDGSGNAWVKANTFSGNFPVTAGAFQTVYGGTGSSDAALIELNSQGSKLLYSTYLGGSAAEYGGATRMIALDKLTPPNVYLTGYTASTNFPVSSGSYQTTLSGANDAFVVKFIPSPNVGLSPASLDFGNQSVGVTSPGKIVTLTNTGNTSLSVTSVSLTGANPADYSQTNTCGTVNPQASCSITVKFTPSVSGTRTANVSVTDNGPGSPQVVSLTGVGIGSGPAVTLSPTSLTFPTTVVHQSSATQAVTLTNSGNSSLTITSITSTGDYSQTNTCGTTVAAGASCTITVTFLPGQPNTRTGTISVADNAPASPQTVSLTGVGTFVQLSPGSLTFANQQVGTSSAPKDITLTNTGQTALTIKLLYITGTNAADYTQTNTCGTSVGSNRSCTISVTFKPTATGTRTASVSISDTGGGSPQLVGLTGTGTN